MDSQSRKAINYTYVTDTGSVRKLNEDSLFCSDSLWLVADGMGGHACGEVASDIASKTIAKEYARTGNLTESIELAHQRIVEAAVEGQGQPGMGTTVIAAMSDTIAYEVAWVGDSRAYLWDKNNNELKLISEDHSLVVRLVNAGLISAAEALVHPQRHMITQCLGSMEVKSVDVDTAKGNWLPEQQLLLCSDGLSDELNDEQIADVLRQDLDNDGKLALLVQNAKEAGGKDNITIVLVDSPVKAKSHLVARVISKLSMALHNRK